ncbi:MAG: hypothetical protein GY805_16860 [Chloroflexi bacterium]|nr:hypothetical protein [Chloroflexota bacterium]
MPNIATKDIWQEVCQLLGMKEQPSLSIMHIQEIESEAENVLELLTVLRTDSYRDDAAAAQETAAELTIALEHLQHHIQELLPTVQKTLDLEP